MSDPLYSEALNLLAAKIAEDDFSLGPEFPYVTGADGAWLTLPAELSAGYDGENWSHGNWFCGFHVGLLLAAYLWTGDGGFLERARSRMKRVALRANDANTHDIGFIFESSAVPMYHITGEPAFADIALKAADRLRARTVWTPKGAYVSSWGPLTDPRGRQSSAIDTMANLPLLYWAADFAADDSFRVCAEAHARMTAAAFVRPDNTTFHAVEYDTQTGERTRGFTFQGYADTSCWSRGPSVGDLRLRRDSTGDRRTGILGTWRRDFLTSSLPVRHSIKSRHGISMTRQANARPAIPRRRPLSRRRLSIWRRWPIVTPKRTDGDRTRAIY